MIVFEPTTVGTGSSTNSQSVTLTLTDDVDPGDPITARHIVVELTVKFAGTAGTTDFTINEPIAILNPPLRPGPYGGMTNYFQHNLGITNQGALIPTGPPFNSGDWLCAIGAYPLLVLSPMLAGDTITVDFTGKTGLAFKSLYARSRVCTGLTAQGSTTQNGIFYGFVFGAKGTTAHLYIEGTSTAPAAPPHTFLNGKQCMVSGCTTLDSEDMSVQIIGGDGTVPEFFDQHISPGDGVTGYALYNFPAVVLTSMNYQYTGTARRVTYGLIQLNIGPGIPYGVTSFDSVFFPQ